MRPTSYIADFDSAAAMLRGLANYLHGRNFALLGESRWRSAGLRPLACIINSMPNPVKEQVYIWSGRYEAIAARKLDRAITSRVAEWVVSLYPQRKYPPVAQLGRPMEP
jgi:hypothetical protein